MKKSFPEKLKLCSLKAIIPEPLVKKILNFQVTIFGNLSGKKKDKKTQKSIFLIFNPIL